MKPFQKLSFITLILFFNLSFLKAQNVVEIPYKPLNMDFFEQLYPSLIKNNSNDKKSIELSLKALIKYKEPYYQFNLILAELASHYANQKQYDKCLEIFKSGQNEGLFYPFHDDEMPNPTFLKELKKLNQYQLFIERNNLLKDSANTKTSTEYMIQLPDNYDKTKKYGLFLVEHGGGGCIQSLQYLFNTPKLQQNYIIAYFQGGIKEASFIRIFTEEHWEDQIKEGYEQIIQNYPIDTTNIILAGPSDGGNRSILLGLNNIIPAKGLLLFFPVVPSDLDSAVYINSAKRGIKIALLCCENDWAIKQQKELAYKLDKYGISNRFVVFPDKGHQFPDNWKYHLDTSIDYILKKE